MAGRPSKLTPELQESICKTLGAGVDVETAALREGISRSTIYNWMKWGREGQEPYASFVESTEIAQASVTTQVTYQILKASKSSWQAAAWWVKWQATRGAQKIELSGPGGVPLSTGQLTPEAADLIRQKILFGEREGPPPKSLTTAETNEAPPVEAEKNDFGSNDPETGA